MIRVILGKQSCSASETEQETALPGSRCLPLVTSKSEHIDTRQGLTKTKGWPLLFRTGSKADVDELVQVELRRARLAHQSLAGRQSDPHIQPE